MNETDARFGLRTIRAQQLRLRQRRQQPLAGRPGTWPGVACGRALVQGSVRSVRVEVLDILAQDEVKVALSVIVLLGIRQCCAY